MVWCLGLNSGKEAILKLVLYLNFSKIPWGPKWLEVVPSKSSLRRDYIGVMWDPDSRASTSRGRGLCK